MFGLMPGAGLPIPFPILCCAQIPSLLTLQTSQQKLNQSPTVFYATPVSRTVCAAECWQTQCQII